MPPIAAKTVVKPHVRISVNKGIKYAQLEGLLKQIVEAQPGGCRDCGLLGFDFSIIVSNPDPKLKLGGLDGLPGVKGFTVGY